MSSIDNYMTLLNATYTNPSDTRRNLVQATLDSQWIDTTLLQTVQEETSHGSFVFQDIETRVSTVSEFITNTIKSEKNYRDLLFQDINHEIERGRFYKFDDNYWMVYAATNFIEVYANLQVRRCNNIAKWIDENNVLHELPCILEYEDSSPKERVDGDVIVPSNGIVLILQSNVDTIKLKENQRFIFNGRPFKINGYNNYMQDDYVNQDTSMLFIDLYLDEILPTDDLTNNIANGHEYDYQVNILENPVENIKNFSGVLNAEIILDNNIVDKNVTWSCNSNATITQDGTYVLVGDVGSTATFTATYGKNTATVDVNIVAVVDDILEIIVSPQIQSLKQGFSATLSADLYKNGVEQSDVVDSVVNGADSDDCYTWTILGNNQFTLTNILRSVTNLNITFNCGTTTKTIDVILSAMI